MFLHSRTQEQQNNKSMSVTTSKCHRRKTLFLPVLLLSILFLAVRQYTTIQKYVSAEQPERVSTIKKNVNGRNHRPTSERKNRNCFHMFEWTVLDNWILVNTTRNSSSPQKHRYLIDRTYQEQPNHTSYSILTIEEVPHNLHTSLTVIDLRGFGYGMDDPFQTNPWHRMISQYSAFVGLHSARHLFNISLEGDVIFLHYCPPGKTTYELPSEWYKLGDVSCDRALLKKASWIIQPPMDGFLWDLAHDNQLDCFESNMFQTFANLYTLGENKPKKSTNPTACWIGRLSRPNRIVANLSNVLQVAKQLFQVQILNITSTQTNDEIIQLLRNCHVLFGIHGAGHMNAIFATKNVAVVEITGNFTPAYYRNINMLLGHYYERIVGDATQGTHGTYHINVTELYDALQRAKNYVIQEGKKT